jgi:hypothetical protein
MKLPGTLLFIQSASAYRGRRHNTAHVAMVLCFVPMHRDKAGGVANLCVRAARDDRVRARYLAPEVRDAVRRGGRSLRLRRALVS